MKECLFYKTLDNKKVLCTLCPKACTIDNNSTGFCGVRKNVNGMLYSLSYSNLVSLALDPIEKKPLFHFFPNNKILSVATVGCNLDCLNCQNFEIAHGDYSSINSQHITPKELVSYCVENDISFIAYTYNEPTVFYEYVLETSKLAKDKGIKTVSITNGYINEKPLLELSKYLDAANIDVKGFSDQTYEQLTTGKLNPVLNTIKLLKENAVWVELTWLVVPGFSDNSIEFKNFVNWLANLDKNIPLHISRFFPYYKLSHLQPTSIEKMKEFFTIAKSKLNFVYLGNVLEESNTYCPKCGSLLIKRLGYVTSDFTKEGHCLNCGYKLPGVFQ